MHPSIPASLIDGEWRMPHAQPGVASLLDIRLRPAEAIDEKVPESLLGALKIVRRVHGSQNVVFWNLTVKSSHQPREALHSNHGINFDILHACGSPFRIIPAYGLSAAARSTNFSVKSLAGGSRRSRALG